MMSQGKLFNELKSGKVFPVYLLLGEDIGAKDEFLQQLQKSLFNETDEKMVNVSVFYGDEAVSEEIIENLSTFSFFSVKKLVIVRDFERLKNLKLFSEYLESPNSDSVLVLISGKKSAPKNILNGVEKYGRMSIFWPMFQNESERWVTLELNKFGIRAEPDAVHYIIELSGTSRNELKGQVDCIVNYLDENEFLSLEKAKKIIASLNSYTVFDLCNALFVKRPGEILKIFRYLINNGEDLVKINYFCGRELRKLLEAYSLKNTGYDFYQISSTLGFRKKESERIGTILKKIDIDTFRTLYSSIASLDYTIKSNPKDISVVSFEKFLMALGK